jgi:lipoprotein-releasing system ATP-binding protein
MRRLGKLAPEAMRERAETLLKNVGLAERMNRSTGHLSGGEQQRVAVARALANEPSLILADEPTGNLDERNSRMVFELLASFAHGAPRAVLVVTHNPDLASRCDEVLRMKDGLLVTA